MNEDYEKNEKLNLKCLDFIFETCLKAEDQKKFLNKILQENLWLYNVSDKKGIVYAKNYDEAIEKLSKSKTFHELFMLSDKNHNCIEYFRINLNEQNERICFLCEKNISFNKHCLHLYEKVTEEDWVNIAKNIFDTKELQCDWKFEKIQNYLF